MFFAVSNLSYFGLDYALTNPFGFIHEDRLVDQKILLETSFLNTKSSDRNTRRNRGRHGRRERWKRRVRRYRTFDASLYDQGVYDLFTIEDLNYGFDRFWLRRKIRNHRVRFRFFPGPWMRSFKKQLARPRLESFMGPRVEFFRILFEQAYHPEFHEFQDSKTSTNLAKGQTQNTTIKPSSGGRPKVGRTENDSQNQNNKSSPLSISLKSREMNQAENNRISFYSEKQQRGTTKSLLKEHSALRKFVRKFKTRTNTAKILLDVQTSSSKNNSSIEIAKSTMKPIYSKRWKQIFSRISHDVDNDFVPKGPQRKLLNNFSQKILHQPQKLKGNLQNYFQNLSTLNPEGFKPEIEKQEKSLSFTQSDSEKRMSKKDRRILRYRTFLHQNSNDSFLFNEASKSKRSESKESRSNSYKPLTLFHPIDFYLQKEKNFAEKMKFYGATVFRHFGVENNAPYYRVMMKKFFYYYKPTLRWERTMRTATMRKARRKGKRIPRKLNINLKTQMLASNEEILKQFPNNSETLNTQINSFSPQNDLKTKIQRPTHFYSLVSKRATRYRYQIYKDVLQHWYYTPFNRLLLKLDVDAFIRRQPMSHFLTKKEENLLHLKRFLLTDYYNTLRWYNSMNHYDTMKNTIGKTKSFANRAYNQQFFGTFKKIRHLFAITPSLNEPNVLKFDQVLFNEHNSIQFQRPTFGRKAENKMQQKTDFYEPAVVHEELLMDENLLKNSKKDLPKDLTEQSTTIVKEYLKQANPLRKQYVEQLLKQNDYSELTNFLYKGQKRRGTSSITNDQQLLDQEKNYLLNIDEKSIERENLKAFLKTKLYKNLNNNSRSQTINAFENPPINSLWITLLKKSRNMLYNQEALKNYVSGRVEKREKQKKREQRALKNRLENMKNWLSPAFQTEVGRWNTSKTKPDILENTNLTGLTTSLQNAIKEGISYQSSGFFSGLKPEKSNLRNNLQQTLTNLRVSRDSFSAFGRKESQKSNKSLNKSNLENSEEYKTRTKNKSMNLKNHLKMRVQFKALQTIKTERKVREKIASLQKLDKNNSQKIFDSVQPTWINRFVQRTFVPFSFIGQKLHSFNSLIFKEADLPTFGRKAEGQRQQNFFVRIFQKNRTKSLTGWKKKEIVLSNRKKIRRKIYRVLDQKKQLEKTSQLEELESLGTKKELGLRRQKQDVLEAVESQRRQRSWNHYRQQNIDKTSVEGRQNSKERVYEQAWKPRTPSKHLSDLFEKAFKRKRTRSRRYRRFKGRGPIKKHTLAEKFKRQFKLLKRYGEKQDSQDKKMEIFKMITKRNYDPNSPFQTRKIKQRRTRQSKHRYWKKHKRQQYLQIKRKQRKRRRYSISKLRVLNKEFKKVKSNLTVKNWWWQTFLPEFAGTADAYWRMEKDQRIQNELADLSISEILKRDTFVSQQPMGLLQIGDQDFKPLGIPISLRLRERLAEEGRLSFGDMNPEKTSIDFSSGENTILNSKEEQKILGNQNIVSKISANLIAENMSNSINAVNQVDFSSKSFVKINPIPFYAGWDETVRKFVVTNRLLSRKEAGYRMNLSTFSQTNKMPSALQSLQNSNKEGQFDFTKAPLEGMNAATTLYWQIPFTTYDPDQFFALGIDGFSPLGWRFFDFKHSKQTIKPLLVKNIFSENEQKLQNRSFLSYQVQLQTIRTNFPTFSNRSESEAFPSQSSKSQNSKNQARRLQKRQKRVKKHPRPPVWFPSGPLTNQILPVHYIYVFYKRTRLPRDRYIGRRLRRFDDPKANFLKSNSRTIMDFTLRKRVKPLRKYHRKRISNKNKENSLVLRRRPFKGFESEDLRSRPILKTRSTKQTDVLNYSLLKAKQRKKTLSNKPNIENIRIRQLRRRVQRQVFRPIWRYKPRSGGIVWPGDYLRFELVKTPTLKINQDKSLKQPSDQRSEAFKPQVTIRKKKRQSLQEWQIQPKHYLIQKHNLKVLKKRLQKSQTVNQYNQKIAQLKFSL